jgi:hypothetical protein
VHHSCFSAVDCFIKQVQTLRNLHEFDAEVGVACTSATTLCSLSVPFLLLLFLCQQVQRLRNLREFDAAGGAGQHASHQPSESDHCIQHMYIECTTPAPAVDV